ARRHRRELGQAGGEDPQRAPRAVPVPVRRGRKGGGVRGGGGAVAGEGRAGGDPGGRVRSAVDRGEQGAAGVTSARSSFDILEREPQNSRHVCCPSTGELESPQGGAGTPPDSGEGGGAARGR